MLTWQLDRLLRSGPICALLTFVLPVLLAFLIDGVSDVDNVLGIMLVASLLLFIGSLGGSAVAASLGVLFFSLGALLAEVPTILLVLVGIGLYTTLIIHDLAGSFRRAPSINRAVWITTAITTAGVAVTAVAAFLISYAIGNLATWQAIVVPFAIAALGFAVKLASDAHVKAARELTAKRKPSNSSA